jgi:hypothetical protein
MNARPQVRDILIAKKMQRWVLLSKYLFVDRGCTPAGEEELCPLVRQASGNCSPARFSRVLGVLAVPTSVQQGCSFSASDGLSGSENTVSRDFPTGAAGQL